MISCQTTPTLNAAQLKIQQHEIQTALKFGKGWLGNMRLFLLCLTANDLSRLSQLLDQVDEHNHLVSAIEVDIQKAADTSQVEDDLKDLQTAIKTFSRTKEQIIQALSQQGTQAKEFNSIVEPLRYEMQESSSIYGWLIQKSFYLGMRAQGSIHLSI